MIVEKSVMGYVRAHIIIGDIYRRRVKEVHS